MTASSQVMDEIFYEKIHIICQNIMASHPVAGVLEISLFYYKHRKITAFNSACGRTHQIFFLSKKLLQNITAIFFVLEI